MDAAELLRCYDEQLRTDAEVAECDEVTRLGPLFLATYGERGRGFITYRDLGGLEGAQLDGLIEAALAHYVADERVRRVEWKTRGHDRPADLLDRLTARGFEAEEPETVMLGDATAAVAADSGLPDGYRLEQATSEAELRRGEAVAAGVFAELFGSDESSTARADELVRRFERDPESFELWTVFNAGGEPVCSGRIDFVDGTEFAGIWGGACVASERGKGLYRALTAARARSAIARGKRYLQSDCTEYSRPILERAGLLAATTTTPALWRRS